MIGARMLAIPVLCAIWVVPALQGSDFSSYRRIQFGANLATAAKQAGASLTDAKTIHQRPALIQEIEWRPRALAATDPVKEGVLCFYNGELSRIVITYDPYKVEGMTAADMVEGISATYGAATKPAGEVAYHSIYGETAPVIARWENAEYAYNLVQIADRANFAMILYSKRLDALAQAAIIEAVRLEALEAPQRELEQQKKRDSEDRSVLEKARLANKPNFRP